MLTAETIAERLMSDVYSYEEFIKGLITKAIKNDESAQIYWDAWFRGAEGKSLELADAGVEFDPAENTTPATL